MKQPLKWHRECLANWRRSIERYAEDAKAAAERYARNKAEMDEYAAQIALAEEEGRDGFDREKFGKKRGAKR